ncbi:MAG: hypothetical protein ACK5N9_03640, partial [Pirellula sp.]
RFAAIQAIHETRQIEQISDLLDAIHVESDSTIFYAAWKALSALSSTKELRERLSDSRANVRRAALRGLLEAHSLVPEDVRNLAGKEVDPEVRQVAELWLSKSGQNKPRIEGRSLQAVSAEATTNNDNKSRTQSTSSVIRN